MLSRPQKLGLAGFLALLILVTAVVYYFKSSSATRTRTIVSPPVPSGTAIDARGTILENSKSATSFLRVKKDNGEVVQVIYSDSRDCRYPFKQAAGLQTGQKITVYGEVVAPDKISVCPLGKYYIRVIR